MNIYLLERIPALKRGVAYDTFDSVVVAADSEDEARGTYPRDGSGLKADLVTGQWIYVPTGKPDKFAIEEWCRPSQVKVTLLGTAAFDVKAGVLCASYNAG